MGTLLERLYGYHAWANNDLFDAIAAADHTRRAAELGAALRLIDHAHVVARIFAAHLSGAGHATASASTDATPTLEELRKQVDASDRWYLDYVGRVTPAELSEAIPFTFTDGDRGCMTREEMLTHVVLHAGYHRGEAGRILWHLSITPPWDTFAVFLHQAEPRRRLQGAQGRGRLET